MVCCKSAASKSKKSRMHWALIADDVVTRPNLDRYFSCPSLIFAQTFYHCRDRKKCKNFSFTKIAKRQKIKRPQFYCTHGFCAL